MSEPDRYASLRRVLAMAVDHAENGKGKERHSNGEPFEQQKICALPRLQGSIDGPVFQACKKAIEAKRLAPAAAVAELLGAINYLAAAVIVTEELRQPVEAPAPLKDALCVCGHRAIAHHAGPCSRDACPCAFFGAAFGAQS